MTYFLAYKEGKEILEKHNILDADTDALLLLQYCTGMDYQQYLLERLEDISEEEKIQYMSYIKKRAMHYPLQYITKEQTFMGFSFCVNEDVLIPRYDTEILVQQAETLIKQGNMDHVLELCTGSGCIAISLKKLLPHISIFATDISNAALTLAKKNATNLHADVTFYESDLFSGVTGTYDMILSNPPYIQRKILPTLMKEVTFEPQIALDGGEDGLDFYRRIIVSSHRYLNKNGYLLLEIGCDEADSVVKLLKENHFREICVIKDLANLDRVVSCHL